LGLNRPEGLKTKSKGNSNVLNNESKERKVSMVPSRGIREEGGQGGPAFRKRKEKEGRSKGKKRRRIRQKHNRIYLQ